MGSNSVITPRRSGVARFRLFCFPYAGGSASFFHSWADEFPPGVCVCAVQLPGREGRSAEEPLRHVAPLARQLTAELKPLLDTPFAVFGHSIGALVGFEFIRQLRREGLPQPLCFVASGLRAPQLVGTLPPLYDLPEPELLGWLSQLDGTPRELLEDRELIASVMPTLRADLTVAASYVYEEEPPLGCNLSAYGGVADPGVSRDMLAAWATHTSGRFRLRMFPGGHFYLNATRTAALQSLKADICEASAEASALFAY
jgi:medium-chain acyl-[acyl-carrier-protein] hydrolase